MEEIKYSLIERLSVKPDLVGLVLMHNTERYPFHMKKYSYYVLAVSTNSSSTTRIEHLLIENERVYIKTVHIREVEYPSGQTSRYHLMDWLIFGEIILDLNGEIQQLRDQVIQFPIKIRNQQIFKEYVAFLDRLFHAERNFADGNILDAYSQVLEALHHWAHIVLIENGIHPEVSFWEQLREVNPGVYKLYEELISSSESVEKRVELVILASEFSSMNKMKQWSNYIIDLIGEKNGSWTIEQLQSHPKMQFLLDDLTLVLQKLVVGQLLKEVVVEEHNNNQQSYEIHYTLNGRV